MGSCTVYRAYCSDHGFIHGAEAEELRGGLEALMKSLHEVTEDVVDAEDVADDLQRLLDRVDARDSLAYLEARRGDDE